MTQCILTVFLTFIVYFFVLTRKNKLAFKEEGIQLSNRSAILTTLFIISTHVKIMWEQKTNVKFVLFVFKRLILRYDVALAILVAIVDVHCEQNKATKRIYQSSYKRIPNIQTSFSNELENVCLV